MPFMDHLKAAEADLTELGSVAEEIATLASGGLATLRAHRDQVKALVAQAVGASQGMVGALGAVVAAEEAQGPTANELFSKLQPPPAGTPPDWSALQGQAASLPG